MTTTTTQAFILGSVYDVTIEPTDDPNYLRILTNSVKLYELLSLCKSENTPIAIKGLYSVFITESKGNPTTDAEVVWVATRMLKNEPPAMITKSAMKAAAPTLGLYVTESPVAAAAATDLRTAQQTIQQQADTIQQQADTIQQQTALIDRLINTAVDMVARTDQPTLANELQSVLTDIAHPQGI